MTKDELEILAEKLGKVKLWDGYALRPFKSFPFMNMLNLKFLVCVTEKLFKEQDLLGEGERHEELTPPSGDGSEDVIDRS